jgi:hypothetical protein
VQNSPTSIPPTNVRSALKGNLRLRTRLTEFELPQVIDMDRNIMVEMTHYLVYYFSDF